MFLSDWCNVKQLLSSYQSSHAADDTDPVSRFSVHGERCARPEVVHSPLSTDDIVSADHLQHDITKCTQIVAWCGCSGQVISDSAGCSASSICRWQQKNFNVRVPAFHDNYFISILFHFRALA